MNALKIESNIVNFPISNLSVVEKPIIEIKIKKPKKQIIKLKNDIVTGLLNDISEEEKNLLSTVDIPIIIYYNSKIEKGDNQLELFEINKLLGYTPYKLNEILNNSKNDIVSIVDGRIIVRDNWIVKTIGNKYFDFSVFKFMKEILSKKKKHFLVCYELLYLYMFNQFTGRTCNKKNFNLLLIIENIAITKQYNDKKNGWLAKEHIKLGFEILKEIGMLKSYTINFKSKIVEVEKDDNHFSQNKPYREPKKKNVKKS
jgi:hypothetical protein